MKIFDTIDKTVDITTVIHEGSMLDFHLSALTELIDGLKQCGPLGEDHLEVISSHCEAMCDAREEISQAFNSLYFELQNQAEKN